MAFQPGGLQGLPGCFLFMPPGLIFNILAAHSVAKKHQEDAMASGWAGDGAVQDQIQDSINDEVARARRNLPSGESLSHCEECGEPIPQARREALPGVRLCVACQQEADREQQAVSLYNRRGSKDSQLR